jgi:hypothetical protein
MRLRKASLALATAVAALAGTSVINYAQAGDLAGGTQIKFYEMVFKETFLSSRTRQAPPRQRMNRAGMGAPAMRGMGGMRSMGGGRMNGGMRGRR